MDALDKEKAQTNPSSVFEKPADLVANKELSSEEKSKALQDWELDARLQEVATEEGMNKKTKPSVLPEVKKAQKQLDVEPMKDEVAPTKFSS